MSNGGIESLVYDTLVASYTNCLITFTREVVGLERVGLDVAMAALAEATRNLQEFSGVPVIPVLVANLLDQQEKL